MARLDRFADDLSDGLRAWQRGDDTLDAEAAGLIVAETLLWWRAWLRSKMQDR